MTFGGDVGHTNPIRKYRREILVVLAGIITFIVYVSLK
tara:strand:+ start:628 stop:741 length:114 start_codon:yes stop_codon:yes gene_type:complete